MEALILCGALWFVVIIIILGILREFDKEHKEK